MKKIVLVYNPVSGNASFKKRLDWIIQEFQQRDVMLIPYRTQRKNRGLPIFLEEAGAEGILAAGGDGTLHEVVNLLLAKKVELPLGIIGSGTSNDFASYLKIDKNLSSYFDLIAAGATYRVDLGRVGEEYFINVASAGMMTSVAHDVDVRLKNAVGRMAYYLKGLGELPKFRFHALQVEADEKRYDLEAALFVILNSPVVGSMKNVAESVRIDDGKLDFLAITKGSIPQLMKVSADLIAGKSVERSAAVFHLQAERFHVVANEPLESDLDGEAGPMLPLFVEAVPKALEIFGIKE